MTNLIWLLSKYSAQYFYTSVIVAGRDCLQTSMTLQTVELPQFW